MEIKNEDVQKALELFGDISNRDKDFFVHNQIFPIAFNKDTYELTIGTAGDPESVTVMSLGQEIQNRVGTAVRFEHVDSPVLAMLFTRFLGQETPRDEIEEKFMSVDPTASDVQRAIVSIFQDAVAREATDVHIEPMRNKVRVRVRIAGILRNLFTFNQDTGLGVIRRLMLDANMRIDELYAPQEGRIQRVIGGKRFDMRLETIGTIYGPQLVIRLLPESQKLLSLEQLGFLDTQIKALKQMLERTGIILTTGPTGSGKTTTQYAMLSLINDEGRKIVTIEDPPEITMEGIMQTAVKPERGASWEKVIAAALRLDPDVILIGEIRDTLSAKVALEAAMTGHLVFATLHVDRIENIPERFMQFSAPGSSIDRLSLSSSLVGLIAQRLLKRVYKPKAIPVPPPDWVIDVFKEKGVDISRDELFSMANPRATGDGFYKGYIERGNSRTVVAEVAYVNDALKEIIKGGDAKDIRKYLNTLDGHVSLAQHAAMKAREGEIDIRDAAALL